MAISAAALYDDTPLNNALSGAFGVSAFRPPADIFADNQDIQASNGHWDTLDLNPWQTSLHDQFYNLISIGEHEAAIDLLYSNLTNYSTVHAVGTLEALDRALYNLHMDGYDSAVSTFTDLMITNSSLTSTVSGFMEITALNTTNSADLWEMSMDEKMKASSNVMNNPQVSYNAGDVSVRGAIEADKTMRFEMDRAHKPRMNFLELVINNAIEPRQPKLERKPAPGIPMAA